MLTRFNMQQIKEITIYECEDGITFNNKNDAIEYVNICEKAEQAEDILGYNRIKWDVCPWIIKHTKEKVEAYRKAICDIAAMYYSDKADVFIECGNGERKFNDAWKFVANNSTKNNHKIYNIFERFECIDGNTFIEYPSQCICDHDINDNVTIYTDIYPSHRIINHDTDNNAIYIKDNYGTINIT